MSEFTVVYDACVLYPAPLRDFLMHLARIDLFRARWTDAIHDEWMSSVLKNRPDIKLEQLQYTRRRMDISVQDCLVTGYEQLIPELQLPDLDDRHVLAAAIKCSANIIVTSNLADLPAETLTKYNIEALHPDAFVLRLLELAPDTVCIAAKRHRQSLKNPPKSVDEYLAALERQTLTQTAATLRQFAEFI